MKIGFLWALKWLIPVFLVLLAVFFYTAIPGFAMSGLVCCGIAGVISCYYLIDLLRGRNMMAYYVLQTVLSVIVGFGILIVVFTGVVVISASRGNTRTPCQYVVVLGSKVNGTEPSVSLAERIDAAYAYLSENPECIAVVSGGKGYREGISEAQCMFDNLTEMGIPAERIWMEDRSTSTWENLNFSLDLIEERTGVRPTAIGLVSSEYHLYRAGLFARDCGVTAAGIPAKTAGVALRINYYLREIAGVWHYLLLGNRYQN